MREFMGLTRGVRFYRRFRKGRLTVYWIGRHAMPGNELIVLIDGGKKVYQINGALDDAFVRAWLATLKTA